MLLEFRTRNYKSFVEEMVFSMTPAPKQKGLDYSVLTRKAGGRDYKGLCSAIIYGPNASGKTNVIGAMDTFKSIVLRGNINNADALSLNVAASSLELIPNCNGNATPIEFGIRFVDNGLLVDYSVIIDLGTFMDKDYPRRVLEERLAVNRKQVFLRNESLEVQLPSVIRDYVNKSIRKKTARMLDLAKDGLTDTELFLNNGFKSIYAQKLTAAILDWFTNRFIVVCHAEDMRIVRKFADPKANTLRSFPSSGTNCFRLRCLNPTERSASSMSFRW